ncbi:MAG: family 78 glycoside hydrolase catalytic domain, partial [Phycisphaeraceae bacterium]|nr:family 78 glycoside hydrolase catalytic domain [Phycisphaeraceae bacterium]
MSDSPPTHVRLRCNHLVEPVGLTDPRPRLSFAVDDARRGAAVTAWRIQAAPDAAGLTDDSQQLADTGWVDGPPPAIIEWPGDELPSRQPVTWSVQTRDHEGQETEPTLSRFETGLIQPDDWQAQWIETDLVGDAQLGAEAPNLRKAFEIDGEITAGRLYITALGLYESWINGERVGDHQLAPGWTDYNHRLYAQAFDVTDLLTDGANAIGVRLGDGWYAGRVGWSERGLYGDRPRLLAQLEVTFADGRRQTLVTDETWRWQASHIRNNDLIHGEQHDLRRRIDGFSRAGFDDGHWQPARIASIDAPEPTFSPAPPMRVTEELTPVNEPQRNSTQMQRRLWIFDLGQNMVGHVRIRLRGESGQLVRLRYGEMLDEKGNLYTENLRQARVTDYVTLTGDPQQDVFEPTFTFHGFRYVEIKGRMEAPTTEDLTGIVVHSDMPEAGRFECSDERVNQLQSNINWGLRGNFLDVPTDCPQRDERLGWTGDAQVFAPTACFNRDAVGFFDKWLVDLADSQQDNGGIPPVAPVAPPFGDWDDGGPAWADAAVIVPYLIWQQTDDTDLLRRHWPMMTGYMAFVDEHRVKDGIRSHPDIHPWGGFGDWLATDKGLKTTDGLTLKDLIGTAYHARNAQWMAKMAEALGETDAAETYRQDHQRFRDAFRRRYLTADTLLVSQTQTACVLALGMDLLEEDEEATVLAALIRDIEGRKDHLSTGFVGTPDINPVLTDHGRHDVAGRLLLQDTPPSWLYPVTAGATTIWERWTSWSEKDGFNDAGMNSFNHYAY